MPYDKNMNKHGIRWEEESDMKNTTSAQPSLKKSVGETVNGS